jgi:AcrR family transcriptional regulator
VDELLAAAAQVFESHGYAAGTTNRIARLAGVSIGTLYQYFPGKDAIAVALLERHIAETENRLHEWAAQASADRNGLRATLNGYVTVMMETHAGRPRLQHILLEETPLPARVHQDLLESERRAAATVAEVLRRYPEIRRPHLDQVGFMVVQTVESLTHRFAAHPDEQVMPSDQFLDELVLMLTAYLVGPAR